LVVFLRVSLCPLLARNQCHAALKTLLVAVTFAAPVLAEDAIVEQTESGPVKATIRLEPQKPLIGDIVTLTLTVEAEENVDLLMPEFGEALDRFSIIDFVPRESIDDEGRTVAVQQYRLQPPSSGPQAIPPILIEYVDRREGQREAPEGYDAYELLTERLEFEVQSVIASVVLGSGSVKSELRMPAPLSKPTHLAKTSAAALLIAAIVMAPSHAQQKPPGKNDQPAATPDGVEKAPSADKASSDKEPTDLGSKDPRDIYNEALAHLDADYDQAERLLTEARREAGTDGEVRFRATYNMGWVEVKRADKAIAEKPQESLAHLRRAADWFRDAVRLRPDHKAARHNLEVVLRRILELADCAPHGDATLRGSS
jgi:hypothetical protein